MDALALSQALRSWTDLLGRERCIAGTEMRARAYGDDVGEYPRRVISAVLCPETPAEVQAIVRVANIHRIPLSALSVGKNWGMGSRQPVVGETVVVDLGLLRQVRAIDVDEGYAIVEPGVTQQALSDALSPTPYIANLTASTAETSVVGNLLDKGIGVHRHRVDDLLGLEVVTGEGEILHVGGYWPLGRPSFHFPSGLGPMLTPLFVQSNFGIVTACVLRLVPRPDLLHVLYATVGADRLVPALAALTTLRRQNALNSVIKLYNAHAFHAYSGESASPDDRTYHIVAALHGSARWVHHVSPFVADTLREARCFGAVAMLDSQGLARAPALVQALARILAGTPTDFAVQRALALGDAEACRHVDQVSPKGLIFIIPIVPVAGDVIRRTLDLFEECSRRYRFAINTTLNILSEHAVEMVSSLIFDRSGDEIGRARAARHGIVQELIRHDIPLMRLDIETQPDAPRSAEPSYRHALVQLKRAFDPHGVLAPGRYIPGADLRSTGVTTHEPPRQRPGVKS